MVNRNVSELDKQTFAPPVRRTFRKTKTTTGLLISLFMNASYKYLLEMHSFAELTLFILGAQISCTIGTAWLA